MRAFRIPRSGFLRAAPLAAALALAGCALNQPPEPQALRADALPSVKVPEAWSSGGGAAGAVRDDWIATFADAQLASLVSEALASNLDLRVAAARVERAAAYAKQAGSTLYPQVNLLASGSFTGSDSGSAFETAGLFVSWELDLWGRVRAQAEAGSAQYEAAAKDAEYARQSIAALVAKSWFLAVEARRQRAIAQEMLAAAEKLAALARERARIGRGDEYDVRLAQASLQGYRDTVLQLQLSEQQAIRAIETLVGRYPAAALDTAAQFPAFPGPVPAGLPSELLERRLDVAAAERRVASAYYLVGEAEAARLPRISLTGSGSSITSDLVFLKDRENPAWSAGGNLVMPLFMGGALKAQVEVRTAEQKAAVADYGRIGARAFSEVENALSAGFNLAARVPVLEGSVAENERALELAQVRYKVGSADQRAVQQQLLAAAAARAALTRAQGERLVQRVNLHLALGGGFGPPAVATAAGPAAANPAPTPH
ncbi:MAG: efflux transporter outer membrane subunit [Betaproteobacteria bacterium]|nr:efflux transporter outer membrane subunit [Betaproteobacteria bacterium]